MLLRLKIFPTDDLGNAFAGFGVRPIFDSKSFNRWTERFRFDFYVEEESQCIVKTLCGSKRILAKE